MFFLQKINISIVVLWMIRNLTCLKRLMSNYHVYLIIFDETKWNDEMILAIQYLALFIIIISWRQDTVISTKIKIVLHLPRRFRYFLVCFLICLPPFNALFINGALRRVQRWCDYLFLVQQSKLYLLNSWLWLGKYHFLILSIAYIKN